MGSAELIVANDELTDIVSLAMDGEDAAFEKLVGISSKYILSSVDKLIYDSEDIQDVVQEVSIQMYLSIGTLKSPYAFASWLKHLIFHVVRDYNNKKSRQLHGNADVTQKNLGLLEDIAKGPDEEMADEEMKHSIYKLIGGLPKMQRITLFLRYYENLSYMEIANRLQVKPATVGANIKKAKRNLRKMIDRNNWHPGLSIVGIAEETAEDTSALRRLATAPKVAYAAVGAAALAAAMYFMPIGNNILADTVVRQSIAVHYAADGAAIEFIAPDDVAANVNPNAAVITLAAGGSDEVVLGWQVRDNVNGVLYKGIGEYANLPLSQLLPGRYQIEYSVVKSGVATARISRSFHIVQTEPANA